jgi:serine/threonine-protein kinase HipA
MPGHGKLSDVIAKLPAKNDDSQIFNEYVAMQLAKAAGVNVASCEPMSLSVIDIDGLQVAAGTATSFLAVERYDRDGNKRMHAEDACQMLGRMPGAKYGNEEQFSMLLSLLDALSPRGVRDVREFFMRQAVNTLIGNSDAHLKNFSVLYADKVHPELSPAYDIVCVAALPNFSLYGMNVAIDRMQRTQTLDMYAEMAKAAGIAQRIATAAVKAAVSAAQDTWPKMLDELPTPQGMREVILERLRTLPLASI